MGDLTMYDVYAAMFVSVIVGGVYGWLIHRYGHAVWDAMGLGVSLVCLGLSIVTSAACYGLLVVLAH